VWRRMLLFLRAKGTGVGAEESPCGASRMTIPLEVCGGRYDKERWHDTDLDELEPGRDYAGKDTLWKMWSCRGW
jgi:hypothetical protein